MIGSSWDDRLKEKQRYGTDAEVHDVLDVRSEDRREFAQDQRDQGLCPDCAETIWQLNGRTNSLM